MNFEFNQISFILELFIGTILFTRCFTPRKLWRWLLVPIAALLYSPLGSALFTYGQEGMFSVIWGALYYAISVGVVMLLVLTCYRTDPLDAFIVSAAGYAAQHCAYNTLMIGLYRIPAEIPLFSARFYLVYVLFYVGVYLLIYAFAGHRFEIDHEKAQHRLVWIIACTALLFFVIVFNLVFIRYQEDGVQQICYIYDTICTLLGMVVLVLISHNDRLYSEMLQMEHTWALKRDHYEMSKENIELINIKCHDIRRHIAELQDRQIEPLSDEVLEEIQNSIQIYDSTFQTGSDSLDVILNEKSLYCRKNGIRLTCMAEGDRLSFFDRTDLYCLLGNIIDNAIESVQQLDDAGKKVIDLTIKSSGQLLNIQEENYFEGELHFKNGLPQTTKADMRYHGFGVKSIAYLVQKYGGQLQIRTDESVYVLNILIPIPA